MCWQTEPRMILISADVLDLYDARQSLWDIYHLFELFEMLWNNDDHYMYHWNLDVIM